MPSDMAGIAGAIHLVLFFMYIPQNLSWSPVLLLFGTPSLFIFPTLPWCLSYLIFPPELDICFLSFVHSPVYWQLFGAQTTVTQTGNKYHSHGAYIRERLGEMENKRVKYVICEKVISVVEKKSLEGGWPGRGADGFCYLK